MEEKCLSDWGRDHLEFEGCFLTRRRGGAEKHAENTFRGLASVLGNVEQESQNLRARRQRRSYGFAARRTPVCKAEGSGCREAVGFTGANVVDMASAVYGATFNGRRGILPV